MVEWDDEREARLAMSGGPLHSDEYLDREEVHQRPRCAHDHASGFLQRRQGVERQQQGRREKTGALHKRYWTMAAGPESNDESSQESDAMVPMGMDHFWKIHGSQ